MYMPTLKPIPFSRTKESFKTFWGYTRKWEIADDYWIVMLGYPTIFIPHGFTFDGASIPKIFRGLLSPVGILLIPAIVHDFCYHYHWLYVEDETESPFSRNITKEEADLLFLAIANQVNGMSKINMTAYLAVNYFGNKAWSAHHKQGDML